MFLRKLKTELTHEPAIPLFGIYLDKTIIPNDTCTHLFIDTLFTIAHIWKQLASPWTDEEIKKMWYIYIYIYTQLNTTQPQKQPNNVICSNMDATRDYRIKCGKSEKER